MGKRRALLVLLLSGAASAAAAGIPELLGPRAADGTRSEVLVLGTVHLAQLSAAPKTSSLAPLLAALERFRPTVVCVEHLLARDIEEMDARGGRFREVAEMFASADIRIGKLQQKRLGRSRLEASARSEELLARSATLVAPARRELVAHLLASFDLPTALLHWSLLPDGERRSDASLAPEAAAYLDTTLASPNETSSLAVPLARGAGLTRLVSVDSQWDGPRLLAQPEAAVEEAFSHPLKKASRDAAPIYAAQAKLVEEALRGGSLLPLYRYINSPAYGAEDVVAQWSPWLRMKLPSGIDRLRYGNWESRNARIVANLTDVTASPRAERVLLVIGVAHKPFVEDALGRLAHVKLVPFGQISGAD